MLSGAILKVLFTQAGAAFLLAIIVRIIPNEKLFEGAKKVGVMVTAYGRKKWGKPFYEPIENFTQNSIGVLLDGFNNGLNSDDNSSEEQK